MVKAHDVPDFNATAVLVQSRDHEVVARGLKVGYIEGPSLSCTVIKCSQIRVQAQKRAVPSRVRRKKAAGVVRLRVLRRRRSIFDCAFSSLLFSFLFPSVYSGWFVQSTAVVVGIDSGDSAGRDVVT